METPLRFLIWVCKVFSGVFALLILLADEFPFYIGKGSIMIFIAKVLLAFLLSAMFLTTLYFCIVMSELKSKYKIAFYWLSVPLTLLIFVSAVMIQL